MEWVYSDVAASEVLGPSEVARRFFDDSVEEVRFFLFYNALQIYSERTKKSGPKVKNFCDLTGGSQLAASARVLFPFDRCVSLEGTAQRQLWRGDWHDMDFTVFDATRLGVFFDEGKAIAQVLRHGLARATAGTFVLLIASGSASDDRCGILTDEGAAYFCTLLDSHVARDRDSGRVLRGDLLLVRGQSSDLHIS